MEDPPKSLTPEQVSDLAEELYRDVARKMGMQASEMFASRQCENMSDELRGALRKQGVEAHIASYHGQDVIFHDFVVYTNTGEEWVADPTWQQFLKKPNSSLPHVLVSKRADLVSSLSSLGVPENLHHIWLQAK